MRLLNTVQGKNSPPQQRMIQSKMSTVPRLRNPQQKQNTPTHTHHTHTHTRTHTRTHTTVWISVLGPQQVRCQHEYLDLNVTKDKIPDFTPKRVPPPFPPSQEMALPVCQANILGLIPDSPPPFVSLIIRS